MAAFTPPMKTDVGSPVVLALRSAAAQVLGSDPGVSGWSATCDASILTHGARIPTVVFGPGSIDQAHTADEWLDLSQLGAAADILYDFLRS